MFFVYILKSLSANRHYYGATSDLEKRLKYHNSGKVPSTKPYRPWKIIYTEQFSCKTEALKRENFLRVFQVIIG